MIYHMYDFFTCGILGNMKYGEHCLDHNEEVWGPRYQSFRDDDQRFRDDAPRYDDVARIADMQLLVKCYDIKMV